MNGIRIYHSIGDSHLRNIVPILGKYQEWITCNVLIINGLQSWH